MRKPLLTVAVIAAVLGALVGPAGADSATSRQTRDATRRKQAEAAAKLDTLRASDRELEGALAALDDQVRAQARESAAATSAARAAEVALAEAEATLAATEARTVRLRELMSERAVQAYMHPGRDTVVNVLRSRDLSEVSRRGTFLDQVVASDAELLDQLREAKEDQTAAREARSKAQALARRRQKDEAGRLKQLNDRRAQQARVKTALDVRISEVVAESAALAATSAQLTALIQSQELSEAAQRAARAAAASPPVGAPASTSDGRLSGAGLIWPVSGSVTSGFGPRGGRLHEGLDIVAPTGTGVRAAKGGTVIMAGVQGGYGNAVIIDHGDGFTTLYAHLSSFAVSQGQALGQGAAVGAVGCTGSCSGPHLHFETRVNGVARDPMQYLP